MSVVSPATVLAAKPGTVPTQTKLGIDISWPQCEAVLPTDKAFAIIGVNGGLANDTNRCLSDQLAWGALSTGITSQDKLQLYVNTANPGGMATASWPSSNVDSLGSIVTNPYGTCDNADSLACAYMYGWNRAAEDAWWRFVPAARAAGVNDNPSAYIWWLDVETENTWKTGSIFATQSNVADLEGMTAYFKSINARVGLYSTASMWSSIVGKAVSIDSNLNGLPNWRPGGANQKLAQKACSAAPLTTGGKVVMTQFILNNLDYNYSCIN